MSFEKGVPPGYLFVWLQENPPNLFEALDINSNKEVPQEEVQFIYIVTLAQMWSFSFVLRWNVLVKRKTEIPLENSLFIDKSKSVHGPS